VGPELTVDNIAGVLDQLYRGAKAVKDEGALAQHLQDRDAGSGGSKNTDAGGVPRRFYLSMRAAELRKFSGRQRSLRSDFFERLGVLLEWNFRILMSFPRLPKDGILGFASLRIVESWPPASDAAVQRVCSHADDGGTVQLIRSRLERLLVNDSGRAKLQPIVLSDDQFCRLAGERTFTEGWWHEFLNQIATRPELFPFVFFDHQIIPNRYFAVMREDYIRNNWRRITLQDWEAALKRYSLEEPEDAAHPGD
jgi:hypothetical protein